MLWVMAFIALTAVYTFPLMHQRSRSVMENIRSGIFLVMDNTKHSIGVLVSGFLIMVFSLISGVGVFFLGIGAAAVLMSTGLREVLKRYDSTDDKGIGEEARGWRDLLRPWGDS